MIKRRLTGNNDDVRQKKRTTHNRYAKCLLQNLRKAQKRNKHPMEVKKLKLYCVVPKKQKHKKSKNIKELCKFQCVFCL